MVDHPVASLVVRYSRQSSMSPSSEPESYSAHTASSETHNRARYALLRDHANVLRAQILLSIPLVFIAGAVLWFQSDRASVVVACCIVLVSVAISGLILRSITPETALDSLENRVAAIQVSGGIGWGALILIAMPTASTNQLFVALLVPIAMASNAMETSSSPRTFLGFQLPFATLATLAFWFRTESGSAQIVFAIVLCTVYFTVLARIRGQAAQEHAELALRNESLAAKLQVLNDDLAYRSTHDTLTSLPNRLAIERYLHEAIVDAEQKPVAALFIDLDGFKHINDTMGHDAGDDLLVIVARRFSQAVPEDSLLGRLGGDEMVVLWPGFGQVAEVHRVADALLESLNSVITVVGTPHTVGASIGVSITSPSCRTARDLLRFADIALYEAKGRGGNQWVGFTNHMLDTPNTTKGRLSIETA